MPENKLANLRCLRLAKGLNQEKLANAAGISRFAYQKIEAGESEPRVSTLLAIAQALSVKIDDLLAPVPVPTAVRFRSKKRMPARDLIMLDVARWLNDYNDLELRLDNRNEYGFRSLAAELSKGEPGLARARRAADLARQEFDLSNGEPICDICGLLESRGVKVYPRAFESYDFFGLSVGPEQGGPAVVINVWDRISVERWIFTTAHELGHLLLHLDSFDIVNTVEDNAQEEEANAFAAHFLMPEESFWREWDETYGLSFSDRILKMKRIFRVSYKTVLYRLTTRSEKNVWALFHQEFKKQTGKQLSGFEEPEGQTPDMFRASFPEARRAHEPSYLSYPDFMADRLARLVRLAIEREEISLGRASEILRLDISSTRALAASWVI